MDRYRAEQILKEANKRQMLIDAMLFDAFSYQRTFIQDPALKKALLGDRRPGKSYCIGLYLFMTALQHPGCSCLYLGLTKNTATGIINKDILKKINTKYKLNARYKDVDATWTLTNGSVIYLKGADTSSYQMEKFIGQKYRLAVLDECSKYRHDVFHMVNSALLPAMGDDLGTIIMLGTPSNITSGLFYDVTNTVTDEKRHDDKDGWSVYKWTWRDNENKTVRANVQRIHDDLVASTPGIEDLASYKQEWLGKWIVDNKALAYYGAHRVRNAIDKLPLDPREYTYTLGVDLGYKDAATFTVAAYNEHDPILYFVESIAREKNTPSQWAQLIKSLWRYPELGCNGRYPFVRMVVDTGGLGLAIVEDMKERYGLPLEAAEKSGKKGIIEVMNAEFQTNRIKVLPAAEELFTQWESIIWSEKERVKVPARWVEDPRLPNDRADSALYAWRSARNFYVTAAPEKEPDPMKDAAAFEQKMFEKEFDLMVNKNKKQDWGNQINVDVMPSDRTDELILRLRGYR